MKTKNLMALIGLFILIGAALTYSLYFLFVVDSIRTFTMDVEVAEGSGISGDTDTLDFGKVNPQATAYAVKFMEIGNPSDHPSIVSIKLSGNMGPWTEVMENNFVLEPDEKKKVEFHLDVPEGAEYGYYTGQIKVIHKRYLG